MDKWLNPFDLFRTAPPAYLLQRLILAHNLPDLSLRNILIEHELFLLLLLSLLVLVYQLGNRFEPLHPEWLIIAKIRALHIFPLVVILLDFGQLGTLPRCLLGLPLLLPGQAGTSSILRGLQSQKGRLSWGLPRVSNFIANIGDIRRGLVSVDSLSIWVQRGWLELRGLLGLLLGGGLRLLLEVVAYFSG